MRIQSKSAHQRGIGLLELMLSLGIIAVLLVMATRYFIVTSRSQQDNIATAQVANIVGAIKNWKGTARDYNGLTTAVIAGMGQIPPQETDGVNITSPFQTRVTIAAVNSNAGFSVTYNGIPAWACNFLAAKFNNFTGLPNQTSVCTVRDGESVGDYVYQET